MKGLKGHESCFTRKGILHCREWSWWFDGTNCCRVHKLLRSLQTRRRPTVQLWLCLHGPQESQDAGTKPSATLSHKQIHAHQQMSNSQITVNKASTLHQTWCPEESEDARFFPIFSIFSSFSSVELIPVAAHCITVCS